MFFRLYLPLFLFTTTLCLFFHQGRSWNVDSRLLTVYAVVEDHRLMADHWRGETGDLATIDGHIYSDKAPLSSFLVIPAYWVYRTFLHKMPPGAVDKEGANHCGILVASAIPFAVFTALVFSRVRRRASSASAAVWITLLGVYGTCLFNYGTIFYGHILAAAFFVGAYSLAVDREKYFFLAGFLGAAAVLTEYTLALTQVCMCLYLLTGPRKVRRLGLYVLGALPGALLMLGYNYAITGKPLDFPYNHVSDAFAPMKTAFGIRLPSAEAAWELLFGQYRGLAFYAPTMLVLVPAIAYLFDGATRRRNFAIGMMTLYFLFVTSYFKWDGGWCLGPRHLSPVIALATYEGAGALAGVKRGRLLFLGLGLWGTFLTLCGSATDPIPAENFKQPFFEIFFPRAMKGEFNDHAFLFEFLKIRRAPYFLGIWFGMLLAFGLALTLLYRWARKRELARLAG